MAQAPAVQFSNFTVTEVQAASGLRCLDFQNLEGKSMLYLWENGAVQLPGMQTLNGGVVHIDSSGVLSVE